MFQLAECDNPLMERALVSWWISDTCSRKEGSTVDVHCSGGMASSSTLSTSVICVSEGKWKQYATSTVKDIGHEGNCVDCESDYAHYKFL